jgi:hypothetical protein
MSSMSDRADEEIGESPEQWVASWPLYLDQEEIYNLQWPTVGASETLSETDVNCLEADMNREMVSSIVPIEQDKGIMELDSLPEQAPLGVSDSSSARPPLQPSDSQTSSFLAPAALYGKGGGGTRSGTIRSDVTVRWPQRAYAIPSVGCGRQLNLDLCKED